MKKCAIKYLSLMIFLSEKELTIEEIIEFWKKGVLFQTKQNKVLVLSLQKSISYNIIICLLIEIRNENEIIMKN